MQITPEECVHEVLDVIPLVMRSLREEFRSHRGQDLSIPQYRTLMHLRRLPGASLSDIADHLGVTLPSASSLVDGLVARGLVDRQACASDRRKVRLALTAAGEDKVEIAFSDAQAAYVERFSALPQETLAVITQAMQALRPIFTEQTRSHPNPALYAENKR